MKYPLPARRAERSTPSRCRRGCCFPSDYTELMDEWEQLVLTYRFSFSDVKSMTVRERTNWLNRAIARSMRR